MAAATTTPPTGTITATITLVGSGITSDALAISEEKSLVVTTPAVESGTLLLSGSATNTSNLTGSTVVGTRRYYLYVKNTSPIGTGPMITVNNSSSGQPAVANIYPGDWMYLPTNAGENFGCKGDGATVEYSYFTVG